MSYSEVSPGVHIVYLLMSQILVLKIKNGWASWNSSAPKHLIFRSQFRCAHSVFSYESNFGFQIWILDGLAGLIRPWNMSYSDVSSEASSSLRLWFSFMSQNLGFVKWILGGLDGVLRPRNMSYSDVSSGLHYKVLSYNWSSGSPNRFSGWLPGVLHGR